MRVNEIIRGRTSSPIARRKWRISKQDNPKDTTWSGAKSATPKRVMYNLRHTAATLLLRMGVHPKLVQELLGHSDIRTTLNRYSHVQPSMQREMMDNFHRFFEEP